MNRGRKGKVKSKRPAGDQIEIKFDSERKDANIKKEEASIISSGSKLIYHDFRADIYRSILNRKMQ